MAGLVPAIHVLQTICIAGGYVCILTNRPNGIVAVNPDWNDLFETIAR
jgi:putative endonuclease